MVMASLKPISISVQRGLLTVCVLFCCACHENLAVAEGSPSKCVVEAVDPRGAFTFSWQQVIEDDAWFSLRNNSSTDQTLTVTPAAVTKPRPGPPLEALELVPGDSAAGDANHNFKVPKHGAILFYLKEGGKVPDSLPPSGSYVTQLLLGAPCDGATSKPTAITITVGKIQPVVLKQSVMVLRPFPWTDSWSANVDAPIRRGSSLPDFSKGSRAVGVLQRDSGGLATVTWTGLKDEKLPNYPEAALLIDPLGGAGTYSGSIVLADEKQGYDGKASTPIELTVFVKDHIGWPAAMIFFSVLIAFAVKRYLGVQRLIWNMGLEEASIGEEYREAERKFGAAAAGKEYGKYSILMDLGKQRTMILGLISKVSKSWGITSIDGNQDYKNASDGLLALHHALSAWGDLGEELAKLGEALSTALSLPQKGIADAKEVFAAEKLLVGKPIKMAEIDGLSKDVLQATQDLDGLVQNHSGVEGPRLAIAMFAFRERAEHRHAKSSPEVTDKRRKVFLVRAIREGDIAVAIFAVVIAELIGLNTKYLGFKPFGTVKDYIDLFVWGAGTKATLDIVTTLLDRVSTTLYRQIPRS
jgi:hypothetical protein